MTLARKQSKWDVGDTENEGETKTKVKNSTNSSLNSPNSGSEVLSTLSTGGTQMQQKHHFLWKLAEMICYLTFTISPGTFVKVFMSNTT